MCFVGFFLGVAMLGCGNNSGRDSYAFDSGSGFSSDVPDMEDTATPDSVTTTTTFTPTLFDGSVTSVVVEVDYAAEAEPAVSGPLTDSTWDLFEANAARLFEGVATVSIPKTLADMERMDSVIPGPYSTGEVMAISEANRDHFPSEGVATFHFLYLDGYAEASDGSPDLNVVGFFIRGTSVVAIFKPMINNLALLEITRNFGEQTALIHEFGHAIGLVDITVPPTSNHHDSPNGAHCTNDACAMFHALEGPNDLVEFADKYATSGTNVLFDEDCLADVDALK